MWFRVALIASLLTPLLHIVVLLDSGLDGAATPISLLSQQSLGLLHTTGLVLFSLAHVALAIGLAGQASGWLWSYGRALLVASGCALLYATYFFATADTALLNGPAANDPLWLVATLIGFAMGALQPGLARRSPKLGWFNAVVVGVWLLLIPAILLVDDSTIGAYERSVGAIYVVWLLGLALGVPGNAGGSRYGSAAE